MKYARQIEKAGADALELNIYNVPTDPDRSVDDIETDYLTIVASVKAQLKIPVAVKISPFFTNLSCFARRLDRIGADALVGAGSVVTKDVPADTVVAGNPARVIRTLKSSKKSSAR